MTPAGRGIKTIAADLGLSRSTTKRAPNELVQRGYLTKAARYRSNGSHTSNLYMIFAIPPVKR